MRLRIGGAALACAALAVGCEGRSRTSVMAPESAPSSFDAPAVVELDLTHGVPEAAPTSIFGTSRSRTELDLVRTLEDVGDAGATKGVFVRLGSARLGLSAATEIASLLEGMRNAGKPVVCHADDYGNAALMLAARGCSKIWVSPAGGVDATGIAVQLLFGNKLLTRFHVDVDFLQVGQFKGAEEPYTRDSPSPEARASLEATLRGIRAAWLDGITSGRKQLSAEVAEDGPYAPEEAKAKGVVDEIGYVDDARDDAKKLASVERVAVRFGGSDGAPPVSRGIVDAFRSVSGASHAGEPHVAVVRAIGAITMGGGVPILGGSVGITEHELGKVIARLTKDDEAKAVVLRIDSPGGSALASDLLWKRLMKLRAVKPLVVSVGGMAASGGYYLACTASKIVAEPTSILGSIGVVGGKFAFARTLDDIGVHAETITASPDPGKAARAGFESPLIAWDDATRARVLASMTSVYDLFLRRVAESRGLPKEKVAAFAEGRIFAGVEAKERGLIDELGGLDRALELARAEAKLPKDAPISVAGEPSGLLDLLGGDDDSELGESAVAQATHEATAAIADQWLTIAPEIGPFIASAAPLVKGERSLAALPFVLLVR